MRTTSTGTPAPAWHGRLLVSPGHGLYVGPAGDTRPHRHHALQLVVALESPFEALIERRAPESLDALLVAADREHRIDGKGQALAIYYVDGSCEEGHALSEHLQGEPALPLCRRVEALRHAIADVSAARDTDALALLRSLVGEILGCEIPPQPGADPAVATVRALLERSLQAVPPVPALARHAQLRQRDLSARFRRETGLTVRRYVLWLRMKAAVSALAERKTLTEAAHAAGFADAAHLSRTFVEMFGVAPSDSVSASEIRILSPS